MRLHTGQVLDLAGARWRVAEFTTEPAPHQRVFLVNIDDETEVLLVPVPIR
jgi:hypothetical protein